jgi:predicted adenine nucleotide alpha hydrolase (AANH) superfamily ATPase
MSRVQDNKAIVFWDKYVKDLERSTVVDLFESQEAKLKRIKRLESNHEKWFRYYFPNYYSSEPAPFHVRSTNRVMNNPEWYEVRPWSRELAKSARTMMEVIKLVLTKKKRSVLLISASADSAIKLLKPYKINFESNQRIINDYGVQVTYGDWEEKAFITKGGCSFVAIGAGQSPRGSRNEEVRPDVVLMDDFDTDVDCRNPDIVDQKWEWFEQAVYATRSISKPMLILFCGNIIAEHCCIKNAMKMADKYEVVNIRDKNGKSTWPGKNTEELIDRALSKISWSSQQKEYFNTPIVTGKVFKKLMYGKIKPINQYKFLVAYTDPSYKKKGDYKATCLLGRWKDEYHVLRMYCGQVTTSEMLDWNYEIEKEFGKKLPVYYIIEWPWIDDPIKLEIIAANKRHGISIHPKADERKKPDKFHRIESSLEPLNRMGKLIFNEKLRDSDHMVNTEGQFLALSPKSRANDDAPDAVEGAKWIVDSKTSADAGKIKTRKANRNQSNKYY